MTSQTPSKRPEWTQEHRLAAKAATDRLRRAHALAVEAEKILGEVEAEIAAGTFPGLRRSAYRESLATVLARTATALAAVGLGLPLADRFPSRGGTDEDRAVTWPVTVKQAAFLAAATPEAEEKRQAGRDERAAQRRRRKMHAV